MAGADYCWWAAARGKCWYDAEHELCTFHRAFKAGSPWAMGEALLENTNGRGPLGVEMVSSRRNPDGSWDLTFRAWPDRHGT